MWWLLACGGDDGHGEIAEGISAALGLPRPDATDEQLATFDRGKEVAKRTFDRADGLGPGFNLTSCTGCHEKPEVGGSAGLYRNFFLAGRRLEDGTFFFGTSAGNGSGVLRIYYYGSSFDARPAIPDTDNVFAQRNPIPFFGAGLLAEIPDATILELEDPDDADGDGISGRANYDRGFVGRFGMKSQTVSIEGFIRGPLNNHLGITSDPLSEDQRARLPVDSSQGTVGALLSPFAGLRGLAQAAAPDGPLTDADAVPDPELSTDDLFDLVSFAMLLAAPEFDELDDAALRGRDRFDEANCGGCHLPRIEGPRGPVPAYSDLLLHDMGEDLADGIVQGYASGAEFRTMPLWGIAAEGPYLHDGRASTIDEAIRMHGGEGWRARRAYEAMSADERDDLLHFLESLGGASQKSLGLLRPDDEAPGVGEYGGPYTTLSEDDQARFEAGRIAFDRELTYAEGVGNPRYNGDSCRACHFDPILGGAGPRDVNVMRHGIVTDNGFAVPTVGTILHRETRLLGVGVEAQAEANVWEPRNTPHVFGLGLVEAIPDTTIEALADPSDADGDGISGRVARVDGGRLGRFGWKAQVPTIAEFVRDAVASELGVTMRLVEGETFGRLQDNDDVADPEAVQEYTDALADVLRLLGGPPRQPSVDAAAEAAGELLFAEAGCAACHTPVLEGDLGPVPLYSDLLLHDILAEGSRGIEDANATMTEFRTAPLWGLAETAPYFHTGEADTIEEAILLHDGEGAGSRSAYEALTAEEQAELLAFLETL